MTRAPEGDASAAEDPSGSAVLFRAIVRVREDLSVLADHDAGLAVRERLLLNRPFLVTDSLSGGIP